MCDQPKGVIIYLLKQYSCVSRNIGKYLEIKTDE